MRRPCGFTLVELLVVILVIGILIAVAAPSFLGQTNKAHDSAAKQSLAVAYKAAKTSTVTATNQGQYGDNATVAAAIVASEGPGAAVAGDSCADAINQPNTVVVDDATGGGNLVLYRYSQSKQLFRIAITAGSQSPLATTIQCGGTGGAAVGEDAISLAVAGNEVTDAVRAAGAQGDGRPADSSFGVWPATTNLFVNGGAEASASGYSTDGSVTLSSSTDQAKFGAKSFAGVVQPTYADGGSPGRYQVYLYNAPRVSVSGGQRYTVSTWVRHHDNKTAQIAVQYFDATGARVADLNGPNVSLIANSWSRVSYTTTAPATATTVWTILYVYGAQSGQTVYWDGLQLEQNAVATPYVETAGATAARAAGRVQAPASLLDKTQGWIAMRVRPGWPSTAVPGGNVFFFIWFDNADAVNDQMSIYMGGDGVWQARTFDATTQDNVSVTSPFSAGETKSLVMAWTADTLKLSVDGALFASTPRSRIPRSSALASVFNIGSTHGNWQAHGDLLWFAAGKGTLTNANAATLAGYSDPPTLTELPGNASLRWTADTATAYVKAP